MKRLKNRHKLLIVGLLLALISFIVVILFGHRHTETTDLAANNGEIIIPISVFIFISYAIFLTIKTFRASLKENFFRYKNVALLSVIIFLCFFDLIQFFQLFNYTGLVSTLDTFVTSFLAFSFFTLPVAFIISFLCVFASIALMRREQRFSWRLTLTVILGLFFCILSLAPRIIDQFTILHAPWPFIRSVIELLFAELSVYLECLLVATVILCVKAGRHIPSSNQDYLIILGCHILPDGSPTKELEKRLNRAIDFYNVAIFLSLLLSSSSFHLSKPSSIGITWVNKNL